MCKYRSCSSLFHVARTVIMWQQGCATGTVLHFLPDQNLDVRQVGVERDIISGFIFRGPVSYPVTWVVSTEVNRRPNDLFLACLFVNEWRPDAQMCCSGSKTCKDSQQPLVTTLWTLNALNTVNNDWWMKVDLLKEPKLKKQSWWQIRCRPET